MSRKEEIHQEFVQRFVWNSEDMLILKAREQEVKPCLLGNSRTHLGVRRDGEYRIFDIEDEESGGMPCCRECKDEIQSEEEEAGMKSWVTQDSEESWIGVGEAAGYGWSMLWFLFGSDGEFSKSSGNWPVEA